MTSTALVCDGCGQTANEEHIARRLKRLENMTRYRPVHVQALFLGAVAPEDHAAHLYSAESGIGGEGAALLEALDFPVAGSSAEALLSEFQRSDHRSRLIRSQNFPTPPFLVVPRRKQRRRRIPIDNALAHGERENRP